MRNTQFRPMTGFQEVPSDGWFEDYFAEGKYFYGLPKYDGIRCITNESAYPFTRKLKDIPNLWVRQMLINHCPPCMDGELVLGPNAGFHDVQSGLMTRIGQPDFRYMVFDRLDHPTFSYAERMTMLEKVWTIPPDSYIQLVKPTIISDFATLQKYEQEQVDAGFEGIILRNPDQPYKYGRSTLSEAGMLKIKRFVDDEAEIIGFDEKMLNHNDPLINALGLQERKHGISGKVPANTLGAFICWHPTFGTIRVAGFKHAYGKHVWENQLDFLHETLTFIYQPHGVINKPRSARFKWIRRD